MNSLNPFRFEEPAGVAGELSVVSEQRAATRFAQQLEQVVVSFVQDLGEVKRGYQVKTVYNQDARAEAPYVDVDLLWRAHQGKNSNAARSHVEYVAFMRNPRMRTVNLVPTELTLNGFKTTGWLANIDHFRMVQTTWKDLRITAIDLIAAPWPLRFTNDRPVTSIL